MYDTLRQSSEFQSLQIVSHQLGTDPLQVQGPGGNTSLKSGDAMLIKASGTWLAEARSRDIFVPCNVGVLRRALAEGRAQQPETDEVVPADINSSGLRASIETAVHAALDWPVVLHTHCVATIALAIERDGPAWILQALPGLRIAFIPYVKPGWDLARAIRTQVLPETQVVVLGNHGLVVCGETLDEAEAMLRSVSALLEPAVVRGPIPPSVALASRLAGSGWMPAPEDITHAVARDPERLEFALGATLYPDHLIFLGPGCIGVAEGEALPDPHGDGVPRKILLFPGEGAAVPEDANPSVLALARCLGDVLARVRTGAELIRLTPAQEAELLDWDAEKYRQSLNRAPAA